MIDEFVDRIKGRRRVSWEGAAERVGDVFWDTSNGTKWLCVEEERDDERLTLDFEEVEPVTKRVFKVAVFVAFVVVSLAAPAFLIWRNL